LACFSETADGQCRNSAELDIQSVRD
jgi:hypothetical protein